MLTPFVCFVPSPTHTLTVKNRKSKIRAKLVDSSGREVPLSEYDLQLGEEDFCFRFKDPDKAKSGKYRVVLANDAGQDEAEVDMKFVGKGRHPHKI